MSYSMLFSLDERNVPLTEEEQGFIHFNSVQFTQVNTLNGRTLYEAIIPSIDKVSMFNVAYANRNPVIIGAWKHNGLQIGKKYHYTYDSEGVLINTQIANDTDEEGNIITNPFPFNETEYLALMPDDIIYDSEGNIISSSRPTIVRQLNKFSGWDDKVF